MLQVHVEKREEILKIEWQTAEIYIPLQEIVEITDDCMTCINMDCVANIGSSLYMDEKVMIKTKKLCYVLFGIDKYFILNKINL
ncbi:hypothetical protein ACQCVL_17055 [Bacillus thuringiensis]|uniref:Sublancin immunity protein SunI-like PH domain-containing protein n=1 Tax=Bacillus cereus TaxID=1396 RepID=A0A9W7Q4P4_BACCE|nr:hypothetical protein [Bacillus cereus]KAA6465535.1 hypothetical protein DX932_15860 [Bacillus cereus]KAB2500248.1 hypothetical protein F8156_21265 [Bacillus cereus]